MSNNRVSIWTVLVVVISAIVFIVAVFSDSDQSETINEPVPESEKLEEGFQEGDV